MKKKEKRTCPRILPIDVNTVEVVLLEVGDIGGYFEPVGRCDAVAENVIRSGMG
jgi:hypothetical protein